MLNYQLLIVIIAFVQLYPEKLLLPFFLIGSESRLGTSFELKSEMVL